MNENTNKLGNLYASIKDVDSAVLRYFNEFLNIQVPINNESKRVRAIYENPERFFSSIESDDKDEERKIQYPLIVVGLTGGPTRRGIIQNREEEVAIVTTNQSKDVFGRLDGKFTPTREIYMVRMPQYYDITYSVRVRANFRNHINKITEEILFSDNKFWESQTGLRFHVRVDNVAIEIVSGEDEERLFESNFTLIARAYLLPEKVDGNKMNKRSIFAKTKVNITSEIVVGRDRSVIVPSVAVEEFKGVFDLFGVSEIGLSPRLLQRNYSGGLIEAVAEKNGTQYGTCTVLPYRVSKNEYRIDLNSPIENFVENPLQQRTLPSDARLGEFLDVGISGQNYNGKTQTIYNQGSLGSAANATQTELSAMPIFAESGELVTENGKPTFKFNGTNFLDCSDSFLSENLKTILLVNTPSDNDVIGFLNSPLPSPLFYLGISPSTVRYRTSSNISTTQSFSTSLLLASYSFIHKEATNQATAFRNNIASVDSVTSEPMNNIQIIGKRTGSGYIVSNMSECILKFNENENYRSNLVSNQILYYGI